MSDPAPIGPALPPMFQKTKGYESDEEPRELVLLLWYFLVVFNTVWLT